MYLLCFCLGFYFFCSLFVVFHCLISSFVYEPLTKKQKFEVEIKKFLNNRKGRVEKRIFVPKKYFLMFLYEAYGFDIHIQKFNSKTFLIDVVF